MIEEQEIVVKGNLWQEIAMLKTLIDAQQTAFLSLAKDFYELKGQSNPFRQ